MKRSFMIALALVTILQSNAQTERFDIASYTAPAGFSRIDRQDVINYSHMDTAAGKFCVISLYASKRSTGDAASNFKKEWSTLAVTPFQAIEKPETETKTTEDGWTIVTGAAMIKQGNIDCYIILNVLSGFGRSMAIRSSLNDPSYTTQIDELFATMDLSKDLPTTTSGSSTLAATKQKFGRLHYEAPKGWSEQAFPDGVVFKPLDLPSNEHLAIQIMTPLNASVTLEEALRLSYDEATAMYKGTKMFYAGAGNYNITEARRSFRGWEYIRGKGGIQVENGTAYKTELGLELFVMKINERFERVAILESRTYCKNSRHYASDRSRYRNSIEQLLFSLQPDDQTGAPLQPGQAKGPGILGVWQGVTQSTTAAAVKLDVFSLIFFDNGQVFYGTHFPIDGLKDLNSRIPPELSRRDWKTYSLNGNNGILHMIFAEIPFRLENNKLILRKNQMDWSYFKMKSVDGARFNGTYTMSESYGTIPAIVFTADGQFTDRGALKVLCHDYVDCVNPATLPGSGSYEVSDYTVTFTYTDGRVIKIAFIGTDYDKNNPASPILRMSYDENKLTRQ